MSYTSHADLGGAQGHGRLKPGPESEAEPFHAPWEARALALTLAMGATGAWNIDMSRSARETLPGYAGFSYYRIWLEALERLLVERGLATTEEIANGRAIHPARPLARVLRPADVAATLARGSPTLRAATTPPRFAPGDRVRARVATPDHHTRLPGYARGRVGTIAQVLGTHVYADAHARGLGEDPHWLYTVAFDAAELWPDAAEPHHRVSIDAWEPYLEPA